MPWCVCIFIQNITRRTPAECLWKLWKKLIYGCSKRYNIELSHLCTLPNLWRSGDQNSVRCKSAIMGCLWQQYNYILGAHPSSSWPQPIWNKKCSFRLNLINSFYLNKRPFLHHFRWIKRLHFRHKLKNKQQLVTLTCSFLKVNGER